MLKTRRKESRKLDLCPYAKEEINLPDDIQPIAAVGPLTHLSGFLVHLYRSIALPHNAIKTRVQRQELKLGYLEKEDDLISVKTCGVTVV